MWHTNEEIHQKHVDLIRKVLEMTDPPSRFLTAHNIIYQTSASSELTSEKYRAFVMVVSQAALYPEVFDKDKVPSEPLPFKHKKKTFEGVRDHAESNKFIALKDVEDFFYQSAEDYHMWDDDEEKKPYPIGRMFDAFKKFLDDYKPKVAAPDTAQTVATYKAEINPNPEDDGAPWIDIFYSQPKMGVIVRVKLDNGSERIGFIDDDENRTAWMLQGTGGSFWRNMLHTIVEWRPLSKKACTCEHNCVGVINEHTICRGLPGSAIEQK